jgi:hypothetical protein
MEKKMRESSLNIVSDGSIINGVAYDLNNILSEIKGRTVLMMNNVNQPHLIRKQFSEILTCVDKGIKTTELLWNSDRVDKGFRRSE